jgi:hypothetical protein
MMAFIDTGRGARTLARIFKQSRDRAGRHHFGQWPH